MKNTRGIPENAEKGLQAIPADSWRLHGVMGLAVNQVCYRSYCIRSTFICQFKFDRQMNSGFNDQANFIQFSIFLDHDWERVAVSPCWPNSFNRPTMVLFQQLRNNLKVRVNQTFVVTLICNLVTWFARAISWKLINWKAYTPNLPSSRYKLMISHWSPLRITPPDPQAHDKCPLYKEFGVQIWGAFKPVKVQTHPIFIWNWILT